MSYQDFINNKLQHQLLQSSAEMTECHDSLFPFQRTITEWAIKKGRAAVFADCGLGKTACQLTWAKNISDHANGKVIIFAPLGVNYQTIKEGHRIGLRVERFDSQDVNLSNIHIANYEQMDKLNPSDYKGMVCDESGILKSVDSKTRVKIIEFAQTIPYRLACTATPAPNDISELANHTEYLGIMKRQEMLSKWFYNNGKDWNLKGHAVDAFWQWVSTWGIFLRKPSDLGFDDTGYDLPKLNIEPIYFDFEYKGKGDTLFDMGLSGIEDRIKIRTESVETKASTIAEMVNSSNEQWIIWCGVNKESDTMTKLIPDAVNLQGSDSNEDKLSKVNGFVDGTHRVLVTKTKIAGFGMNFQNCRNMIFFGMSDSYEAYYQSIRRCYRFGQKEQVNAYIALAGNEVEIYNNVLRKESDADMMADNIIKNIQEFEMEQIKGQTKDEMAYSESVKSTDNYTAYNGDSCEVLKKIQSNSIDLSVFSPPFSSLYTYSNSARDLGNSSNDDEFFNHFKFIIDELMRVVKPGRLVAVHCMNIPTKLIQHGYIGLLDFRGDIIRAFQKAGFIYHAEVTVNKNPQVQAIRTKAKGLLFVQMEKDSSASRMGLPDYICVFKKPGENQVPIKNDLSREEWIEFASPVWNGLCETDTLNSVKYDKDEKHICPLQLPVIERCVRLWSNKGETVLSPFMGIGSEGVVSIQQGRKFTGIELKPEYYKEAVKNIDAAVVKSDSSFLSELMGVAL